MSLDPNQFLTRDEALQVDAALLSSQEKFTTRVAIYALRTLTQIANTHQIPITELTPDHVVDWITHSQSFDQSDQEDGRDHTIDRSFIQFFARLVLSSLHPLTQISSATNIPFSDLTVRHVITWFEQQSKVKPATT